MGSSLVVVSRSYCPVSVHGLLIMVVSLWRNTGSRAQPIVMAHGLSCSKASGIFLDPGSNPCLLQWQVDSLPLSHQRSLVLFVVVIGWKYFLLRQTITYRQWGGYSTYFSSHCPLLSSLPHGLNRGRQTAPEVSMDKELSRTFLQVLLVLLWCTCVF